MCILFKSLIFVCVAFHFMFVSSFYHKCRCACFTRQKSLSHILLSLAFVHVFINELLLLHSSQSFSFSFTHRIICHTIHHLAHYSSFSPSIYQTFTPANNEIISTDLFNLKLCILKYTFALNILATENHFRFLFKLFYSFLLISLFHLRAY